MEERILENADRTCEWLLSEDETPTGRKNVCLYVKLRDAEEWEFVKSFDDFESAEQHVMREGAVFGPVKVNKTVTRGDINAAMKVLIDNGIEPDEAETVLQAIGYALLDAELFEELLPAER